MMIRVVRPPICVKVVHVVLDLEGHAILGLQAISNVALECASKDSARSWLLFEGDLGFVLLTTRFRGGSA